jgi:hypothetical protein
MPDTHDERGADQTAAEVVGLLRSLPRTKITPENITQHMIDRWYREKGKYLEQISDLCDQIRDLSAQLTAATARAESATVLPERWRALIAERDAAVDAWSAQQDIIEAERRRAEKAEAEIECLNGGDISGWTAEENAEFEQRYGVKAAMHLRAANDRVWQVVQELRQAAVNEGRDPYQDPMARRLSAALVGAEGDKSPRSMPSGPTTEYRYLLTDGRESEFELHNEGPCGCRREERPVYVGEWRPAPHRQVNATEGER